MNNELNQNEEIVVKERAEKPKRSADTIRRLNHGRLATVITVAVVVLTLLLNVVFYIIGNNVPMTIDFTKNKTFSLSEESVAIADSLVRDVEIVVFASEDTFANSNSADAQSMAQSVPAAVLTEFYSAINQYKTLTDGKITVTYVDMNRNPQLATQYSQYKKDEAIAAGDVLFISDKLTKCANILTGDFFEMDIEAYYTTGAYEYQSTVERTLATNLKAVQSEKELVVTFATGYDEDSYTLQGLEELYRLNGYDIETVKLTGSSQINPNSVCLIIPAPTKDYSTESIEKIRTWLHNDGKEGRNLMVFTERYADCPNLYEYLNVEYGIEVTDNIIIEENPDKMYAYSPYYAYATIMDTDYTPSCAGGEALTGYARQIIPHWEMLTDKTTQTRYSVNLLTYSNTAKIIPVTGAGDNSTPKGTAYDGTLVGMVTVVKEDYQNALQMATKTTVTVCGSSIAPHTVFTSMKTVYNDSVFLDTMSAVAGATNTVNISSKSLAEDTASFSTTVQLVVGLGIFTILLPLVLMIAGLVVFLRRRHL